MPPLLRGVPGILIIYVASVYTAEERLRCLKSQGICEREVDKCYNIEVCPDNGVPHFCMAVIRGNLTVARDCFDGDSSMTYCNSARCVPQPRGEVDICCCNESNCNRPPAGYKDPPYETRYHVDHPFDPPQSHARLVAQVVFIVLAIAMIPSVVTCLVLQRRSSRRPAILRDQGHHCELAEGDVSEDTPLYPQLAGEVELGDPIESARGGFGRVHLGKYTGLDRTSIPVAVKVFNSQNRQSWLTERTFYTSRKMCRPHDNIVKFYGARDEVEVGSEEKEGEGDEENGLCGNRVHHFWIITEYHRRGSLSTYLSCEQLSWEQLYVMVEGLAGAVEFLHSFDDDPVVHRDIKSQNILVKEDLTVCLADFGLSLAFDQPFAGKNLAQAGTLMYMAPEMLESAIDDFNTQNFLAVDVYAMGLVLWEMVSRCIALTGVLDRYRLPYEREVGTRPSVEAMTQCVSVLDARPIFQHHWLDHPILGTLCDTIACCWEKEPEERISAGTVLARLADLPARTTGLCIQGAPEGGLERGALEGDLERDQEPEGQEKQGKVS